MKFKNILISSLILLISLISPSASFAEENVKESEVLFVHEIYPLLQSRCFPCHGENKKKGELDLRTLKSLLKGGESGEPILVRGKPQESLLFKAITWQDPDLEMPPKKNDRLNDHQVAQFKKWIQKGAPWPETPRFDWIKKSIVPQGAGIQVPTTGGLSPDWTQRYYKEEDLWAYRDLKETELLLSENQNPIDVFIDTQLRAKKLTGAPQASPQDLVRRLHFTLTGLGPRVEEVQAFLENPSENNYLNAVDRLLASPHYGERMAQHWLDVVRYADTAGFSNDWERPHAWRYRDYVIRSFQKDKPFNQFIVEQIAGDELKPRSQENLIATGFLRMGPWEQTAMSVKAVTRQLWLDDVTNLVGETFLAQPLRCAKCHDHKFDPIPTIDYYRFQAAFASTQFAEAKAGFLGSENIREREGRTDRTARILNGKNVEAITQLQGDNAFSRVRARLQKYRTIALKRFEPLTHAVKTQKPQPISILEGGNLERPTKKVQPGVLSVLNLSKLKSKTLPATQKERRLALANWIASEKNPLTARVIVNRVWQWHFGRGLALSPNNFGKTGGKPSHPELLDYLARWFVQNEWSIKKLQRLILTSRAFKRSSVHPQPEKLQTIDPANRLLARYTPRRLSAEEIRDHALYTSNELSKEMGGPGIFPSIHWEVALQPRHVMGGIAPSYRPSDLPAQRNRRTIYAFKYRGLSDPMLEVFNRPGPDLSCERRDETTIAPQALELLNGDFLRSRALKIANDIFKSLETPNAEDQINTLYSVILNRAPNSRELKITNQYLTKVLTIQRQTKPKPITIETSVERSMIAEETGVLFKWREFLALEKFVPDLQPSDCKPEIRALAELALVLMNSSEFMYVY